MPTPSRWLSQFGLGSGWSLGGAGSKSCDEAITYLKFCWPGSLLQPRGLLAQKSRKKFGQKAGIDYLKYLTEQGKEDTFLDLVNFLNDQYRIAQRIEREFAKTRKQTVNYTDTYQVEVSKNDSFEQRSDIDCSKFNAQG
jgi:hypothetical protein